MKLVSYLLTANIIGTNSYLHICFFYHLSNSPVWTCWIQFEKPDTKHHIFITYFDRKHQTKTKIKYENFLVLEVMYLHVCVPYWYKSEISIHSFPMLFLYFLKTSENRKVCWCFQGVEIGCTENKWINDFLELFKYRF